MSTLVSWPTPRPRQPAEQEAPEPREPVEDGRAAEGAGHLVGAVVVAGASRWNVEHRT
ncbi:hypothetical protein [Candidatus Chloroploca sp. Khr17]|uniref:hypothetical protein n=1 Tax=Candidatus Chloroploca sp. Khr17 TaxID=2496869 RepID=UPI00196A9337|nr:hypothetical protein [Candidatus Chloroploca sp. Khr17]